MKIKTCLLLPMLAITLTACMPIISKQACRQTDWYQRGMNDGAHGASANVQPFAIQCAKYHIPINTNAYYQGWRRALNTFCSYKKGLNYGQNGKGIPGGCAGSIGQRFYKGWQSGVRLFCSYTKGLNLGSAGKARPQVCHGASANDGFNRGYQTGTNKYCGNLNNGYSVGRNGLPYPDACSPDQYPGFYNAYQQGRAYYNRISSYQARLDTINERISDLIQRYNYHENADGSYRMSSHHNTPHAREHLAELNRLIRERTTLENAIFKQNVRHRHNWNYNGNDNGPIIINIK